MNKGFTDIYYFVLKVRTNPFDILSTPLWDDSSGLSEQPFKTFSGTLAIVARDVSN